MKYIVLTIVVLVLVSSVWVINDRADKLAQEVINVCNERYEKETKINLTNKVSNSDNIRDNAHCQAEAYKSAESNKKWGVGAIAVGTIVAFLLARSRAST